MGLSATGRSFGFVGGEISPGGPPKRTIEAMEAIKGWLKYPSEASSMILANECNSLIQEMYFVAIIVPGGFSGTVRNGALAGDQLLTAILEVERCQQEGTPAIIVGPCTSTSWAFPASASRIEAIEETKSIMLLNERYYSNETKRVECAYNPLVILPPETVTGILVFDEYRVNGDYYKDDAILGLVDT